MPSGRMSLDRIEEHFYEKDLYLGSVKRMEHVKHAKNEGCFGNMPLPNVFRTLSRKLSRKNSNKSI